MNWFWLVFVENARWLAYVGVSTKLILLSEKCTAILAIPLT
jgi:hypothetical protein